MAEVGYNSKFEGQEVDSRLENVVQAAPGTGSESGKGGLIPAPPAGSQDGSKTLLSDMTWGDYVNKKYIDDAVSAAGWKKQIVDRLPSVEEAKDNVMYLMKDDVASTETSNVYNEYILVTGQDGQKTLESLGMVSTDVKPIYIDLSLFSNPQGTIPTEKATEIYSLYQNGCYIAKSGVNYMFTTFVDQGENLLISASVSMPNISNLDTFSIGGVNTQGILVKLNTTTGAYTSQVWGHLIKSESVKYVDFMSATPKVVTTLVNLPKDAHNIIANVSSATNLSMSVSSEYAGREWQVRVNNTTGTDITQPLPTSGLFQSMSGDSVVVPKNSFIELSIWYINDKLVIRVGEQA